MSDRVLMNESGAASRPPRRRRWLAWSVAVLALAAATGFFLNSMLAPRPTIADMAYADRSPSQKLDLFMPPGAGPFPVVVYIHGGAFKFGDKREPFPGFRADIDRLKGMGIALASINYRMSGEARFPAAVADSKAAVRYLRANAARLNLNPDAIGVWGKSAGANLALQVGLTAGNPSLYDAGLGLTDVSDQVQAVISMFGPTDFLKMDQQLLAAGCGKGDITHDRDDSPESLYIGAPIQKSADLARAASPISHVSAAAPPILLQAGTADCTVPGEQSRELHDALLPLVGADRVRLDMLQGAGHGDSKFDSPGNLDIVADFLRKTLLQSRH